LPYHVTVFTLQTTVSHARGGMRVTILVLRNILKLTMPQNTLAGESVRSELDGHN